MKILLIQPPHYYEGGSRGPSVFPIGLGYLARVLLNLGYDVEVFDIWAHQYSNKQVIKKIEKSNYDVVGISALSTQYKYVKWLTSELREHSDNSIIVGGALTTLNPEIVLRNTKTDICVIGEGEITFPSIIKNIDNLKRVNGIMFKEDGNLIENPPREYIEDLDTIEFPAWDLFPIEIYLKNCHVWKYEKIRAMNIITSRGCPWNCRFCSKTFRGVRLRSIDNVIEEIKELGGRYNIKGVYFNDELVLINKKRAYELCDKIRDLNLRWSCQGRVNLVDFDLLRRMRECGCVAIGYGVESGSQKILDNMNKQITVKQIEDAIKNTVKTGIYPAMQMMFGYPGETRETVGETVDLFRRIPYVGPVSFAVTTPLPGTELYDYALKQGLIGDEEEYLEKLEAGYVHYRKVLVNLTDFNDGEYHRTKAEAEKKILRIEIMHLLLNPVLLFKEIYRYGFLRSLKKISNILRNIGG